MGFSIRQNGAALDESVGGRVRRDSIEDFPQDLDLNLLQSLLGRFDQSHAARAFFPPGVMVMSSLHGIGMA